jgi:hypothetical protein
VFKDIDGIKWDKFHIRIPKPTSPHLLGFERLEQEMKKEVLMIAEDIRTSNVDSGRTSCSPSTLAFTSQYDTPLFHTLSFKLDTGNRSTEISGMHLHLTSMPRSMRNMHRSGESQEEAKVTISLSKVKPHCSLLSSSSGVLTFPTDGVTWTGRIKSDKTWVSPDISSLLGSRNVGSEGVELVFVIKGESESQVDIYGTPSNESSDSTDRQSTFSTGSHPLFSPKLLVYYTK